jgi:hypothetical protein
MHSSNLVRQRRIEPINQIIGFAIVILLVRKRRVSLKVLCETFNNHRVLFLLCACVFSYLFFRDRVCKRLREGLGLKFNSKKIIYLFAR